jgi:6-phosphofructokinase 1
VKVDNEDVSNEGIRIKAEAFPLAGPQLKIAFDPQQSKAAVVTCGGLCPGEFHHGNSCFGLIYADN